MRSLDDPSRYLYLSSRGDGFRLLKGKERWELYSCTADELSTRLLQGLDSLRGLAFQGGDQCGELLEVLKRQQDTIPPLELLSLSYMSLDAKLLEGFLDLSCCQSLHTLSIPQNEWSVAMAEVLATHESASQLKALDLGMQPLDAASLRVLSSVPFKSLRALSMQSTEPDTRGLGCYKALPVRAWRGSIWRPTSR